MNLDLLHSVRLDEQAAIDVSETRMRGLVVKLRTSEWVDVLWDTGETRPEMTDWLRRAPLAEIQ